MQRNNQKFNFLLMLKLNFSGLRKDSTIVDRLITDQQDDLQHTVAAGGSTGEFTVAVGVVDR
jgi:hypothetical protein